MTNRDHFEALRALESQRWLSDPDRIREDALDRQRRLKADIKSGHSTRCGILKCANDCPKLNLKG